jgi:hypothetical protein
MVDGFKTREGAAMAESMQRVQIWSGGAGAVAS